MKDRSIEITRVPVLGTRVSACSFEQAVAHLACLVSCGRRAYVSCANAYSLSLAWSNESLRQILDASDMTTADGMPVVWALRILGHPEVQRVHNDDLVLACCQRYPGWRHYFLGGAEGQPERVANELRVRFPEIRIAGLAATPKRPIPASDNKKILAAIRHSGAEVVWVGMGTPAQDYWMRENSQCVQAPLVGCGSLFDLLAGNTRPAPEWMKHSGLQWLFRLIQEPRRLLLRYSYHNTRFVFGFIMQRLGLRFRSRS